MTRELPTGTVTFLFRDVEGSTALPDEIAGALSEAVARRSRDHLVRALALARPIGYA